MLAGLGLIVLVLWAWMQGSNVSDTATAEQREKWEDHLAYSDDLAKEVAGVSARDLREAPPHELAQLETALKQAREIIEGEGASSEEERIMARLRRQQSRVRIAREFQRDGKRCG